MTTPIDPDNPVVTLCADGMQAEVEGRFDDARAAFHRAWEASTDDYEACIAAHYLARHQPSDEATLHWNQVALDRADAVPDERVAGFYPSLLLNLGHSHECLGRPHSARVLFEQAEARLQHLPAGPYTEMVRRGIAEGLRRTSEA